MWIPDMVSLCHKITYCQLDLRMLQSSLRQYNLQFVSLILELTNLLLVLHSSAQYLLSCLWQSITRLTAGTSSLPFL